MEYKDLRVTEWRQAQPIRTTGKLITLVVFEGEEPTEDNE